LHDLGFLGDAEVRRAYFGKLLMVAEDKVKALKGFRQRSRLDA
jgi:hypothetical protein